MADITGTVRDDFLIGTDGVDRIIDRSGGNDRLWGGAGDDRLFIDRPRGLYGSNVTLWGGTGADNLGVLGPGVGDIRALLIGGEGGDEITAADVDFARIEGDAGQDLTAAIRVATARIGGGLGNDVLAVDSVGLAVIAAGDGRDWLFIDRALGSTIVDMGADDDIVSIAASAADDRTVLTLGAGRDTVYLGPDADRSIAHQTLIVIRDFETGFAQDRFDASSFLRAAGIMTSDPLRSGHYQLVQRGDDTVLQLDRDAGGAAFGWETVVRFQDVEAAAFVPFNLGAAIPSMRPGPDAFAADLAALIL